MAEKGNSLQTQVAIVGGGPVGMLLALFLDRYGVKSVVFNTEGRVRMHPKGSSHNSRTMEHYRRLGISGAIRKLGLPPDHPKDVAYFTRLSGWELARYRMPSEFDLTRLGAATQATDQIPEPMLRANQMYVEDFLLSHARTRPNIVLHFGWEAGQFSQDADGVSLTASRVTDGSSEQWRAYYLVGCDGGQSAVRRSFGVRYSGYDRLEQAYLGGRMISTYLRAPTLYRDYLSHRRAWMYWIVNPDLRSTLFSLNGQDEFMFWTKPRDPEALPDESAVRNVLFRCIGAEAPVEFIGHQPWTAGAALVAERFADRRILLAGDAVHLFTPTGGFGMNTGIDDVANLSWKLAAMLQGWGGKSLGAPPINVLIGDDAHTTVFSALQFLGLGHDRVVRIPTDDQGAMLAPKFVEAIGAVNGPTIVILQAGQINTGAFDLFEEIVPASRRAGAWVHIDGAFGLWARACPSRATFATGVEQADSWATDGHKWLQTPYDCGFAIVRDAEAHRRAMTSVASYLPSTADGERDPSHYVPELSRRARGFATWALIKALGRKGVGEMIERHCRVARLIAARLASEPGVAVLNDVKLNQIIVRFGGSEESERFDRMTTDTIERIQSEGTCFVGGAKWRGRQVMRVSVIGFETDESQGACSADAIIAAYRSVATGS